MPAKKNISPKSVSNAPTIPFRAIIPSNTNKAMPSIICTDGFMR